MSPVPAAPYQKRWVMLLQLVAVGAGLVLGIVIRPEAVTTLLFSAVLQLVATVIGWRGIGGPVAYAGAVALVVLGAAADPALRELLYVGEIGRASCREREEMEGDAGEVKKEICTNMAYISDK